MGTGEMLGVTLRWTSIPSRGGVKNTPSRFMLMKPEISAGLMMSLLARKQRLYFTLLYFTLLYFTLLYFTLLYFTLLLRRLNNETAIARVSESDSQGIEVYSFVPAANCVADNHGFDPELHKPLS